MSNAMTRILALILFVAGAVSAAGQSQVQVDSNNAAAPVTAPSLNAEINEFRRELRAQREEIERLRATVTEQSRIIEEMRAQSGSAPQLSSSPRGAAAAAAAAAEGSTVGDAQGQRQPPDHHSRILVLPSATEQLMGQATTTIIATSGADVAVKPQETSTRGGDRLTEVETLAKRTSEALAKQLGSISFSGDLRLRFESFYGLSNALPNGDNPALLGNELSPRYRGRIRARLAVRGQIGEEFDWGLRLSTGSLADNISSNQTTTDFFNRKQFALDQAFLTYRPRRVPGLSIQGGKFEPPWTHTEMTFDNDIQVEGVNQSYSRDFKNSMLTNLTFAAWQLPFLERNSGFVRNSDGTVNIDQSRRAGRDLALYGAHLRARFAPRPKVALTVSASDLYFSGTQFIAPVQFFGSHLQLPVTITLPATATTPAQIVTTQVALTRDLLVAGNGNLGLTTSTNNATNRDGRLASGFNLVDLIGTLDLTHSDRFPVTLLFNFVINTRARDVVAAGLSGGDLILSNNENTGYWAEIQVGRARARGDLLFGYTLMRIEKDAVLTPFNFSDVTQQSDMRAHRLVISYTTDPRLTFSLTGVVTQQPNGTLGAFGMTPPGSLNRPTTRLQFDTVLRF